MCVSKEEANFVKGCKIFWGPVPDYLQKTFIRQWDRVCHSQRWKSDQASGSALWDAIPSAIKSNPTVRSFHDRIISGKEDSWSTTILMFILVYSGVDLIPKCRPRAQRTISLSISEEIEALRETRSSFYALAQSMSCPLSEFRKLLADVKCYTKFYDDDDDARIEKEIDRIADLRIKRKEKTALWKQLDKEVKSTKELDQLIKDLKAIKDARELKENVKEVKDGVKEERGDVHNMRAAVNIVKDGLMDVKGGINDVRHELMEMVDVNGRITPSLTINAHPGSYVYVGNNGQLIVSSGSSTLSDSDGHPHMDTAELRKQTSTDEHQKQADSGKHDKPVDIGDNYRQTGLGEQSKETDIGEHQKQTGIREYNNEIGLGEQIDIAERHKQMNIANLKAKYKDLYEKHEIHFVDRKGRISVHEVKVTDFAVRLHISNDLPPKGSFRDEAQHHIQNLKYFTGDNVELSELIDHDNRVTFIRGIAGMGKSVLSKQLVCGWANDEMYKDFKVCVMFECRELNYFKATKGAMLKDHEIVSEFVKEKVGCDLGDGQGVFFVVDGLDELYDIKKDSSVIQQLVNRKISKFSRSKVIITGRPHVENKLEGYGIETGGLRKVEILGLDDGQINEYIDKSNPCEDHRSYIRKAKKSSKPLPIVHVPQFLNTFCCIAILRKGEVINDPTELYCWTMYFLLKQHADKSSAKTTLPQIFQEYAEPLKALGKVCHELLAKNKIIFDGSIQSLLGGNERGNKFIQSLFVDVSDDLTQKYQFKHLSLMEFLSAIHICGVDNRIDMMRTNLENGWVETVSFVCRLIAGMSSSGIIKETLTNINKVTELNTKQFMKNVFDLLRRCKLDDKTKLKKSLEIAVFFLNKNFKDKKFLLKLLAELRHKVFESNFMDSRNIMDICDHLVDVCRCKEEEIRKAFKDVRFGWFVVTDVRVLSCAKYFESIDLVEVRNCKLDSNGLRKTLEEKVFEGCRVGIVGCEFIDEESYVGIGQSVRRIDRLLVSGCRIGKVGFGNLCELGISSGKFQLLGLDINRQWWEELADLIERKSNCPGFYLKDLEANKCTTEIDKETQMKIIQCGVSLKIDGIWVEQCSTAQRACAGDTAPPQMPIDHDQRSMLTQFWTYVRTSVHRVHPHNCIVS